MKQLIAETRFNYLGCYYFQSLNKIIYLLLIVLQVMHSMSFNGLFDIPQLFLIITLASLYAYRKEMPVVYGFLTFGIAYYIQFALTLKMIYGNAVE